jgi:hypothetical protein
MLRNLEAMASITRELNPEGWTFIQTRTNLDNFLVDLELMGSAAFHNVHNPERYVFYTQDKNNQHQENYI